ncbi:MAG: N-acetylmuramoyl-L-alanine amidase [Candidatus Eisenbacteria bacterium]
MLKGFRHQASCDETRRRTRRFDRRLAALALLVFFAATLSPLTTADCATTVQAVRHWTAPDHTRIVIDLSERPKYRFIELADPARIVVEVSKGRLASGVEELAVSDGLVEKVRFGRPSQSVVQIIVDLTTASEFKVFHLADVADKPHRIVVDVRRKIAPEVKVRAGESVQRLKEKDVRIVVLDPGHGGEDPGAVGPHGLREKDICLEIAKRLKEIIDKTEGMKAFLTRTGDYFVPLRKRTRIAKELGADAFVSIHANASRSRGATGTEVFFLSLTGASDEAARDLAAMENAADLVGGISPETEGDIVSILTDLKQSNNLSRSSELAECILDALVRHRRLVTRGVKQAGFTVLKSADFPCVLVEVAFISNASEASLLKSEKFRNDAAELLASALKDYFRVYAALDGPSGSAAQ